MGVSESATKNLTSGGHTACSTPARPDLDSPNPLPDPSFRAQFIPAVVIASGAVIAIGSLAPWISEDSVGVRNAFHLGTDQGLTFAGPLTLLLGVLTVVVGIAALPPSPLSHLLQRSSIVTGVAEGVILLNRLPGLRDMAKHLNRVYGTNLGSASLGLGYWMCGAGALLAVIAGIALPRRRAVGKSDGALTSSVPLEKSRIQTSRS
jgi:hypothetical protein